MNWPAALAGAGLFLCSNDVFRRLLNCQKTMKNLVASIVLILVAVLVASAQPKASDEAVLRRMLDEFLAGAGRNDAAIHDRFWAEDLIYTRSAGQRINKAELMKGV